MCVGCFCLFGWFVVCLSACMIACWFVCVCVLHVGGLARLVGGLCVFACLFVRALCTVVGLFDGSMCLCVFVCLFGWLSVCLVVSFCWVGAWLFV